MFFSIFHTGLQKCKIEHFFFIDRVVRDVLIYLVSLDTSYIFPNSIIFSISFESFIKYLSCEKKLMIFYTHVFLKM